MVVDQSIADLVGERVALIIVPRCFGNWIAFSIFISKDSAAAGFWTCILYEEYRETEHYLD